jgi:sporulation protein YlmC with PRC-barrel domain
MYRISNIISLPVINIFDSKYEGIVDNTLFDIKSKKLKYISIYTEDYELTHVVKIHNIFHIGQDCILINNAKDMELKENICGFLDEYINPINLNIYDLDGSQVGKCSDIIIDQKFNIKSIAVSKNTEIPANKIKNIGNSIILTSNSSFNINKFKPNINSIKIDKTSESSIVATPNQVVKTQNTTQQKIITDYTFLIGRTLSQTIQSFNGEIIAKEGSPITKDIIRKASLVGKLLELTRYSTKKELTK